MLQQQKLALANGILTGTATKAVKSLTIDDLKMLFNPQPPVRSAPVQGAVAGAPGFSGIAATKYWLIDDTHFSFSISIKC